jgi:uncharacterized membrane protein YeaQ/YmgE (transglycosylase-associated protein family)
MGPGSVGRYGEGMDELFALVAPMLVIAGLACGWVTEAVSPAHGYGLRGDMGLGVLGSAALAGALYGLNWFGGTGLVVTFVIGLMGAAFAIIGQRAFWQSPHLRT